MHGTIRSFARLGIPILLAASCITITNAQTAARDPLLVSSEWLQQHLNDKDLVVLHVSEKQAYDAGHIPGARYAGPESFVTDVNGLILELPPQAVLHKNLQALGIGDTSRIVVYFAGENPPVGTRAMFTLDVAGLGNRAMLLDGGLRAWQRSGNALSKDVPTVTPGKLAALTMQPRVVDAAFVQQHLQKPGYKIIDARAPVFYEGVEAGMGQGTVKLKGHLPGATNIPFTSVTAADLGLASAQELAKLFKAAGVEKGDRIIAYCHIGLQGTAVVFAARTLGIDAVLYDGSFQDWATRGLPVTLSK